MNEPQNNNNNNNKEKNHDLGNGFRIPIDLNVSPDSNQSLDYFLGVEIKGKRKVDHEDAAAEASTADSVHSEKKLILNSDFKYSECDVDLELTSRPFVKIMGCLIQRNPSTSKESVASNPATTLGNIFEAQVVNQCDPGTSTGPANNNLVGALVVNQYEPGNSHGPTINNLPEEDPVNNNIVPEAVIVQGVNQPEADVNVNVGWTIQKRLKDSDIKLRQNRLLIERGNAHHIMNHLNAEQRQSVDSGMGIFISVYDQETDETYRLRFSRFPSTQCYVINGQWYRHFVLRKGLNTNDDIGLRWDVDRQGLVFSVLNRAPPQ